MRISCLFDLMIGCDIEKNFSSLSIKDQFYNQFDPARVSGAFSMTYARLIFGYITLTKQLIILYAMIIKTSSV